MNYSEYKINNIKKAIDEKIVFDNFNALTSDMCRQCSQEDCCCNKYPCIFAPSDFLDITNLEYMKKVLDTGLVCVSESKNGFLTLRPIGKREIYNEPKYQNNTCIFYHYETGCMLNTYLRPTQGLLYLAKKDIYDKCVAIYTKDDIYSDYKPYQDVLEILYKYQKNINIDVELFNVSKVKIKELTERITKKPLQN